MKTTPQFRWILCSATVASFALSAWPLAAAAKTNAAANVSASAELQPVAIPQSDFTVPKVPKEGRDPFFPDSLRMFGTTAIRTNATPSVASYLLKGLAGPAGARFATISTAGPGGTSQSVDLAIGEEREIVTSTGRVKVRCLEIKEELVVIEAGGVRRELRLRPGR